MDGRRSSSGRGTEAGSGALIWLPPKISLSRQACNCCRDWLTLQMAYLVLCAATLVCCLLLGGGTRAGFLSDAALQLLCIPLLLAALWRLGDVTLTRQMRWALAFCLLCVFVPLFQLIPLPPAIWTALPARKAEAASFALLGRDLPWMLISVSPTATWLSLISQIPPLAIFLGTVLLGYRERRILSLVILAVGVMSVFLGLAQIAQGPSSSLRPFVYTNDTEAVGFFANRNHFAALLYSLTLLAAAWAVSVTFTRDNWQRRGSKKIVAITASFTQLVALIAAQTMARSRAGLGLTMVALLGAFALVFVQRAEEPTKGRAATKLLGGAIAIALLFGVQFALYRILERFAVDPLADGRVVFARVTTDAAQALFPLGAGVGTFVPVYAEFEKPQDAMSDTFANRAHNDFLEGFLESGIVGTIILALFLTWFAVASLRVWRRTVPDMTLVDRLLPLAATVAVGLLLAHSLADYPLRTAAIMGILAFSCALLIEPIPGAQVGVRTKSQRVRELQRAEPMLPAQRTAASFAPARSPKRRQRWGADVDWPKEWRKPQDPPFGKPGAKDEVSD
jgi:O-antigen ligase